MDKHLLVRTLGLTVLAILIGVAAGIGIGRATQPGLVRPAPWTTPLAGIEAAPEAGPAAPLFAAATPALAPALAPQPAGQAPQPAGQGTAPPSARAQVPSGAQVPGNAAVAPIDPAAPPPDDLLVLPHGNGRYVSLMLQEPGPVSAPVLRGTMTRDGPVNLASVLRNPTIRTLRGPVATVELLHLGYDRDARPIVAHIRLPDGPETEGLVVLHMPRKGLPDLQIRVVPVPAAAEAKPAPESDL